MEKMISNCGLICSECPAFIAFQTNDDALRRKTAEQWSKMNNAEIPPESINCEGCLSDGRLFGYCHECEIRSCCQKHEVDNCAYCADYGCEKITNFFEMVPQAKSILDEEREK
ncbi:MAG TPA: DUF3795 domain-containing protein [Candidatus Cloacimonadota bacterium]|nr:DUF3795 domain-containing protein [Candidatus Cloacimonadota bacterium]